MFAHRSHGSRPTRPARHTLVRFIGAVLVSALVTLSLPLGISPASAASVTSVSLSGGMTGSDGLLYAKSGSKLNLTASTDAARCVRVSGGLSGEKTSNNQQTTWTWSSPNGLSVPTGTDGVKTVTVTAYDNVTCTNNTGTGRKTDSASYVLDNTGPVATATLVPPANAVGWNNSVPVNITWKATDAGVGFDEVCGGSSKTLNPCTASVTTFTSGTTLNASATDRLGNTANPAGSVTVKVDTGLPTITGSRSPAQPASGWNNTPVEVSFVCSDPQQSSKDIPAFASGIKT